MSILKKIKADHFGRVGVFLGGSSHERPISLKSGRAVYQALKKAGLQVVRVDTANGFHKQVKSGGLDLAFLALHGQGGEDGTAQRLLTRARISYTGSDPKSSALAFDKNRAKKLFVRFGIPTPRYDLLTSKNWKQKIQKWAPPYVIKPVREGSSIGVFFIDNEFEAQRTIESGLREYGRLMVEAKIGGREFTVGILGKLALPVIELRPKRDFYDYEAKYTKGLTDYLIPAPISNQLGAQLQTLALKAHRVLGLRDFSRVDFKVDEQNRPYVLEVNSIPGFTEMSLLPKAAEYAGISFTELCLQLLEMAKARQRKK